MIPCSTAGCGKGSTIAFGVDRGFVVVGPTDMCAAPDRYAFFCFDHGRQPALDALNDYLWREAS